jgi:hypothetical protein
MTTLKNRLLEGEVVEFHSETGTLEVSFNDSVRTWDSGFKIVLNAKLVHSSKTFKSMETKLNKLISTFELEEI